MRRIALFTDPYPYYGKWDTVYSGLDFSRYDFRATFKTSDNKNGLFVAEVDEKPDDDVRLKIDFEIDGDIALTGKGEAVRIFSTVVQITKSVLDSTRASNPRDWVIMSFVSSGNEFSRDKLYARLAYGIAKLKGGKVSRAVDGIYMIEFPPTKTASFCNTHMRKIALFDKPLPYAKQKVENGWYVRFETPKGQKITETCYVVWNPVVKNKHQSVKIDPPRGLMFLTFQNMSQMQDPFGMTGSGEEIPIFSTVVKATLDLIDGVRATKDGQLGVKFEAKESESGRLKLYDKLANGLARMRGGKVEAHSEYGEKHYKVVFPSKREEEIIEML